MGDSGRLSLIPMQHTLFGTVTKVKCYLEINNGAFPCRNQSLRHHPLHRILPLASEANMPPKQRTVEIMNAVLALRKKSG